jgi:hypothetical protein
MKKTKLLISSENISVFQKVYVTLFAGIITALITFLVFYLLNGNEWRLINAGYIENFLFLLALGTLLSHFYLRSEFKKFHQASISLDELEMVVRVNDEVVKKYDRTDLISFRVDRQFYIVLGMKRLSFLIKPKDKKRMLIEVFLVKKEDANAIITKVLDYQENFQ